MKIPYGRQHVNEEDIAEVVQVLKSDFLTQGPMVEKFEKKVAEYCGARYAVAVSNATAALHMACLVAGLKKGQNLWTSPNSFVASSNCGLYCGANVDFIDIDSKTYNISITNLEKKLASQKAPEILIPVHFSGQSCDMRKLAELKKKYNFVIIEDASHAVGARYQGAPVGGCQYSDMTVFSFHPVKIITTGEGGMILTNRDDLYKKLLVLRSHGITRDIAMMPEGSAGPWYYAQIDLGYNYRMADIQAALGFSQMNRLNEFIEKRKKLVARYNEKLHNLPLVTPFEELSNESSWHLYMIRLKTDQLQRSKKEIYISLQERGIGVNVHYIPIPNQPYYKNLGFKAEDFPEAQKYYQEAITIPLFPTMTDAEQDYICEVLKQELR